MDPSRPPTRGRARARARAGGDPALQQHSPPQGQATGGSLSPQEGVQQDVVYSHMFEGRRLSDESNGNGSNGNGNGENGSSSNGNGRNGSNGNGQNGSNGDSGSSRGRGSPFDGSRGGSPRGMSPRGTTGSPDIRTALDYLFSRPSKDFSKKVTPAANQTVVTVATNYFRMKTHPHWNLSLYTVKCNPETDEQWRIRKLVASHRERIGSYILTGRQLFTTKPIGEDNTVFTTMLTDNLTGESTSYTVTLEFHHAVAESEPIVVQFYNTVVRQIQQMMAYNLIGRHFYDSNQKVDFPSWRLSLWPGFQNSIRQQETGLMMNVESVWKVLQTDSILTIMTNIRRQHPERFEQACNEAIVNTTVITTYGDRERAYKVSRIDYEANPESTFSKSDGTTVIYHEYFRDRYNAVVRDRRQPMLVSEPKLRDQRRGQTGDIYLVPELCYPCGLNDSLRSNFTLMKALAGCLHMPPTDRVKTMVKFIGGAAQSEEIVETLRHWGLKIPDPKPVEISARMLSAEEIVMAGGVKVRPDDKADWTMGIRGKPMLSSMRLKNWAIVVTNRDSANVGQLISTMQKVAGPLGYTIERPAIIRVNDPRGFSQGVGDAMSQFKGTIDMIMIILANNNADIYATVKKRCSIEYGIPSQCFLAKNIGAKGLMSIATKVVIQMNAKQGGEPWGVVNQLKNHNLMVLGYDVHHAGPAGGASVGAMTATVSPTLGSYYSCVEKTPAERTEVATIVASMFSKCLNAYRTNNGILPDWIMMYRDGVGEGQLKDVNDLEIKAFTDRIKTLYTEANQGLPKLAFIVVNKRISTRFFLKVGAEKYDNPKPGLVVDDVVTRPERYDFFLISPTARQGCVSPTYYNVLLDQTNLGPDKLQRFTYKLCHMYYNWSGTVAVPAPCQNAHKLAFLVGTALKRPANGKLAYLLHFL